MENPRHLSGSRIRPGTVIERSQIKFVIFKMQEDVNGVLARMINTSACKQPSNVSTLRCKMNRWKAPLIANIPWAQSPFLPRRAVITTAVPRLSSLGVTGARAGVGPNVTRPGWGRSVGSGSRRRGDLSPVGAEASGTRCPLQSPMLGSGLGTAVKYKIPAPTGPSSPFVDRLGQGNAGQVPLPYRKCICECG